MLINIHQSLVDNQENETKLSEEILITLEILALAIREGKHLVIANRETLKKILECTDLAIKLRQIYTKISKDTEQFQLYLSKVSKYIEVCQQCPLSYIDSTSGKDIIKVSPRFFNDSEMIQKTILLCENADDTKFYEKITEFYLWKEKLNTIFKINFEPRGGGGSTTVQEYDNIQKRFCLCILDSDKKAPHSSLGLTEKLRQEKDQLNEIVTTQLLILNVREVENLIPNSIIEQAIIYDPNPKEASKKSITKDQENALEILKSIQNSHFSKIRYFLDLKKGTLLKTIFDDKSDQTRAFWESKIKIFFKILKSFNRNLDERCINDWECRNQKECNCYISFGLGKNILNNTIKLLEKNPKEISSMVDNELYLEWEKIAKDIINWCLAIGPIRG